VKADRGRSELTPAQHVVIRRQLALIPVYMWLVYSYVHLIVRLPELEPTRDFVHFQVQGVIALERDAAALYDINRMADVAERVLPTHHRAMYPPVYGPQVSVFFMPFGHVSYIAGRNIWIAVILAVYALCTYAVYRICPQLRRQPGTTALLLIAAPALHFLLGFVQISIFGLIVVTAAYFALRANRPFLAGLALGSLVYKPPLALGIAFVFGVRALMRDGRAERRIVAGALVAAAAQLAVGVIYWGPSILPPYVMALTRVPDVAEGMEPFKFHMHSWRTFFDLLLPDRAALIAYVAASLATAIGALMAWSSNGPLALRYSAVLIATVLVDPHLYSYDLILLVPALMLLWNWQIHHRKLGMRNEELGMRVTQVSDVLPWMPLNAVRRWPFYPAFMWLLYICYFAPLFSTTIADYIRVQASVPLMGFLGVVILAALRSEKATAENAEGAEPRTRNSERKMQNAAR